MITAECRVSSDTCCIPK